MKWYWIVALFLFFIITLGLGFFLIEQQINTENKQLQASLASLQNQNNNGGLFGLIGTALTAII